jgi:hypothetical protein
MLTSAQRIDPQRYARCIEVSKRVRWDTDRDVLRGRQADFGRKFLPDGLSKLTRFGFLGHADSRLLSQIQGRTYANMLGLFERFINAKMLELSRDHWLGDQVVLEALVRFSDEELKHQQLFRRLEQLVAAGMPAGYRFVPQPDRVADAVLGKCSWAVLALASHIELLTQAHYQQSIAPDAEVSDLFKDVFLFHWKEEAQHAVVDELEWLREDARLAPDARERAVDDLIALLAAVDGLLQQQAAADAGYFAACCSRRLGDDETLRLRVGLLDAYRWQYIRSGIEQPRFFALLTSLISHTQRQRLVEALAPILETA